MTEDDGRKLSAYELKRQERIQANLRYLKACGLVDVKETLQSMTKKTKRKAKRVKGAAPSRESKRLKQKKNDNGGDGDDLVMLSYRDEDGLRAVKQSYKSSKSNGASEDDGGGAEDFLSTTPRRRRLRLKISLSDESSSSSIKLTEAEKKVLKKNDMDQNYLDKFQEFLVYHDKISERNERNVMRQVTKLAHGEGVRYESRKYGWPKGCYFYKGTKVTLLSDFIQLRHEALDAERKWGTDRGNGWLLQHPLQKLLIFQQFCLKRPDFLTSDCKLKD